MSDPARPTDDELGREVRDAQVKFWSSQPGYIAENWLWGWDDPRLPQEQREVAIAVGRALFSLGVVTAMRTRRDVDAAMP